MGQKKTISTTSSRKRRAKSILSPLRYPGSKRRFVDYIELTLKHNGLLPALFVEPFAGGASVALQLLQNGSVQSIGLVDRDPLVAAFWQTVFFDTEWLIRQIESVNITLENWQRFRNFRGTSTRGLALACLFLNRTSFSGILADSAGPIGGANQNSPYGIDCRFPRTTLVKRVRQAAELRQKVRFIWNMSWEQAVKTISTLQDRNSLPHNIFYYLDPPFFNKADRLYRHFFTNEEHAKLRDALLSMPDPWLLSYDAPEQAKALYGKAPASRRISTIYSASAEAGLKSADEIILSNLPRLPSSNAKPGSAPKEDRALFEGFPSNGRRWDLRLSKPELGVQPAPRRE